MKAELRYNDREMSWRVYLGTYCIFEAWGLEAKERAENYRRWIESLEPSCDEREV